MYNLLNWLLHFKFAKANYFYISFTISLYDKIRYIIIAENIKHIFGIFTLPSRYLISKNCENTDTKEITSGFKNILLIYNFIPVTRKRRIIFNTHITRSHTNVEIGEPDIPIALFPTRIYESIILMSVPILNVISGIYVCLYDCNIAELTLIKADKNIEQDNILKGIYDIFISSYLPIKTMESISCENKNIPIKAGIDI